VLAEVRALSGKVDALDGKVEAQKQEQQRLRRLAELDNLLIKPSFAPSSSGSMRSPHPEDRIPLKVETIDYYGLWASKVGDDSRNWTVYPMLADTDVGADGRPAPVPLRDAILAHVWPSNQSQGGLPVAKLLGLPENFNVRPRNFLILSKPVEKAFDADALLLLPRSGDGAGVPPAVVARVFRSRASRVPSVQPAVLESWSGRLLYLPNGNVPFLRLLGWKAVSALRASFEEEAAAAELPSEVDLNATVSHDGTSRAALPRAVNSLLEAGARFSILN